MGASKVESGARGRKTRCRRGRQHDLVGGLEGAWRDLRGGCVGGVRRGWPDWCVGGVGMLSRWDWRVSGAL